jgi:uncharacterized membrane protein
MDAVGSPVVEPPPQGPLLNELGAVRAFFGAIRTRIVGGLILALPFAITFWIVYQLYLTFQKLVIAPMVLVIRQLLGTERFEALPGWWQDIVAPLVGIASVLALLYFLGLFVSTRLARFVDWLMLKVPLVTTIYQAVRGVFQSLNQKGASRFKRVVSVAYPHATIRVPGFVMKSMLDVETGRTILSVFVPFAPLPTSGFVLLVPEDDVIDLGWTVNEAMQGVVSGGLSMPSTVRFSPPGSRIAQSFGEGAGSTRN